MAGDAGEEDEAAWRDLIARYSTPATGGGAPWPVREDVSGTPRASPAGPGSSAGQTDPGLRVPPLSGWPDPIPGVIPGPPAARVIRPATPAPVPPAGGDDHYVPPDPPPLPRLDPVSKGAWTALFAGPGYLLLAVLLGWSTPGWAAFCAIAAFVGGFAALVTRMSDRPPTDSGPDDGAVV